MKNVFLFLAILWLSPLFSQNYYPCACLLPEKFVPAVNVTEQITVRSSLDAYATNILTMNYGQEKVMLLGVKDSLSLGDRKAYTLVSTEDGTQGWVEYAKIVPCGEGKVIAKNTSAFKDNDRSELSGYAFRAGEAVIATETVGDLIYVYAKNKSKRGWVSIYDIVSGKDEFQAAIMLEKALLSKEAYNRKLALEQLNSKINSNMQIFPIVQSEYWKVADASPLPPTPMPIPVPAFVDNQNRGLTERKANVPVSAPKPALTLVKPPQKQRSTKPALTENRSITERAIVSPKTEKPVAANPSVQSRTITEKPAVKSVIKAPLSYQKNIEKYALVKTAKIAPDKVFACLHPKLPIGTKVRVPLIGNNGYVVMEVIGKSANNAVEMSDATIKRVFGNQIPQKVEVQYFTTAK